jgi:hypothetical protein
MQKKPSRPICSDLKEASTRCHGKRARALSRRETQMVVELAEGPGETVISRASKKHIGVGSQGKQDGSGAMVDTTKTWSLL